MAIDLYSQPHRRYNALSDEWVQVSPHRNQRPWQGHLDSPVADDRPAHDPACSLCPGNERAGGQRNPDFEQVFVFDNDFAALLDEGPIEAASAAESDESPLLQSAPVRGACRVICFSPRHDLTLAQMSTKDIGAVIDLWGAQVEELSQLYRWVQVFENKGAIMGCSNPHPHGQIWALDALPNEPAREDRTQAAYYDEHGSTLLSDYVELECDRAERIVEADEHWVALVPFWAVWPFEILLAPRVPVDHLHSLDDGQRQSLAHVMQRLLRRYDALFATSFPYSMGWHGAPSAQPRDHWHLHAHFYPPLLRSASVRKFMVGYELLAEAQRDLTPEQAAARLRELPVPGENP